MKKIFRHLLYKFLFLTLFTQVINCEDLDTTFGTLGMVNSTIGTGAQINSLAIHTDGKIITGGFSSTSIIIKQFTLVRYNTDGTIDTTFGTSGIKNTLINDECQINSIAIQTDGKIITAGSAKTGSTNKFAVARYNTDGTIDTTFGTSGTTTTTIGSSAAIKSIVIQSDGKIIAAGGSGTIFAIARYNIDGTIDTNFGTNGITTTTIGDIAFANSAVLQTDGKIIAAGYSIGSGVTKFALARYNTNGTIDTTFGTNGIVTTTIDNSATANVIKIQSTGKIIVAGFSSSSTQKFTIVRYNTDGTIDTTFGTSGITKTAINNFAIGNAMVIQSDDKILVAGYSNNNSDDINKFAVARYSSTGTLDTTFGTGGAIETLIQNSAIANAIILQSDGRAVVGGYANNGTQDNFALARYNKNNTDAITITSPTRNSTINKPTVTITGSSSSANTTVKIYVDNVLFKTLTSDGSGDWLAGESNTLADGNHTIKANLIDGSNNIIVASVNNFTINTTNVSPVYYERSINASNVNQSANPMYNITEQGRYFLNHDLFVTTNTNNVTCLKISTSNVVLNLNSRIISKSGNGDNFIAIEIAAGASNIYIYDGTIASITKGTGIKINSGCDNIVIYDTDINSCETMGMFIDSASNITGTNIRITNCTNASTTADAIGLKLNACKSVKFEDSLFNYNQNNGTRDGYGVLISSSFGCEFTNCIANTNKGIACYGFRIQSSTKACMFKNCLAKNNQSTTGECFGFSIDTSNNNNFEKCESLFNNTTSSNVYGFNFNNSKYNLIKNCLANNQDATSSTGSAFGFRSSGGTGNKFEHCQATGNSGGTLSTSIGSGFALQNAESRSHISLCESISNDGNAGEGYGIMIGGTASTTGLIKNVVINNLMLGNTGNSKKYGFKDFSTGTTTFLAQNISSGHGKLTMPTSGKNLTDTGNMNYMLTFNPINGGHMISGLFDQSDNLSRLDQFDGKFKYKNISVDEN